LTSGSKAVRVEETLDSGVIISALEIIEAGFRIVVVAPVAQGVLGGDGGVIALGRGDAEEIAPGIVGILRDGLVGAVKQLHHVALTVDHIVIGIIAGLGLVIIPPHGQRMSGFVVGEVQAAHKCARAGVGHVVPDDPAVLGHILMPFIPVAHWCAPLQGISRLSF